MSYLLGSHDTNRASTGKPIKANKFCFFILSETNQSGSIPLFHPAAIAAVLREGRSLRFDDADEASLRTQPLTLLPDMIRWIGNPGVVGWGQDKWATPINAYYSS